MVVDGIVIFAITGAFFVSVMTSELAFEKRSVLF